MIVADSSPRRRHRQTYELVDAPPPPAIPAQQQHVRGRRHRRVCHAVACGRVGQEEKALLPITARAN